MQPPKRENKKTRKRENENTVLAFSCFLVFVFLHLRTYLIASSIVFSAVLLSAKTAFLFCAFSCFRGFASTIPETNIAPENGWLENYLPFGKAYFQGLWLLALGRVASTAFNSTVNCGIFNRIPTYSLAQNFSLLTRKGHAVAVLCCVAVALPWQLRASFSVVVMSGIPPIYLRIASTVCSLGVLAANYQWLMMLPHQALVPMLLSILDTIRIIKRGCLILGPRVNHYMTEIGSSQMVHSIQTS